MVYARYPLIMSTSTDDSKDVAVFDRTSQLSADLRSQIERVIVGQRQTIQTLLAAILCQGHVLIVGVPGLAKTLLVKTLADAINLRSKRIQFTPDMMPSDILGTELIQEDPTTGHRALTFAPGPIFAQLVLADEVNRAPPKTQAALLEAMAERQVTVAGKTMKLDQPFIVVATQNPIEQEGTYPLPEAQLDRFMFSISMDYPDKRDEIEIVSQTPRLESQRVQTVIDPQTLLACSQAICQMPVSHHVVDYAVSLARATRPGESAAPEVTQKYVDWGAGLRAGQCLMMGAKALAAMAGQPTASCDHVRQVAMAALRHRILTNYAATGEGVTAADVVTQIMAQVPEPDYM